MFDHSIPESFLCELYSGWLELKDIAQLDTALTNQLKRSEFLSILAWNVPIFMKPDSKWFRNVGPWTETSQIYNLLAAMERWTEIRQIKLLPENYRPSAKEMLLTTSKTELLRITSLKLRDGNDTIEDVKLLVKSCPNLKSLSLLNITDFLKSIDSDLLKLLIDIPMAIKRQDFAFVALNFGNLQSLRVYCGVKCPDDDGRYVGDDVSDDDSIDNVRNGYDGDVKDNKDDKDGDSDNDNEGDGSNDGSSNGDNDGIEEQRVVNSSLIAEILTNNPALKKVVFVGSNNHSYPKTLYDRSVANFDLEYLDICSKDAMKFCLKTFSDITTLIVSSESEDDYPSEAQPVYRCVYDQNRHFLYVCGYSNNNIQTEEIESCEFLAIKIPSNVTTVKFERADEGMLEGIIQMLTMNPTIAEVHFLEWNDDNYVTLTDLQENEDWQYYLEERHTDLSVFHSKKLIFKYDAATGTTFSVRDDNEEEQEEEEDDEQEDSEGEEDGAAAVEEQEEAESEGGAADEEEQEEEDTEGDGEGEESNEE